MKGYINQIFHEGLGSTLYTPIKKLIDKKTKGKVNKVITILVTIIYIALILLIAFGLFYVTFPFI